MRLTIPSPVAPDRDLDVDVDPGLPAGGLRRRLALLTGDARWASPGVRLHAAGRALDDDHPVGAPPLLPGAHLTPSTTSRETGSDVDAARDAGAHVAVVAGPDAGLLHALPDGRGSALRLHAPGDHPGDHHGGSPGRPGRPPVRVDVRRRGARVQVRVVGGPAALRAPAGRTCAGTTRRGVRRVGRLPRRWPAHLELQVGSTRLRLRGAPWEGPVHTRGGVPPWVWTAAVPAVAAVGLAVALRQPVLLLTAVTGVVGLIGLRGVRGPRGSGSPGRRTPGAGTARPADAAAPDDPAAPDDAAAPGDVAALRVATDLRLRDRTGPVQGDESPWPADRTLALTGARGTSLGAARALVLRTLGAGTATRLVVRTVAPDDWWWTRWWDTTDELPGPDDADVLVVADGAQDSLGTWRLAAPRARLLVVTVPDAPPPAWAGTVLQADALEGVTARTAEDQARRAAALTWLLRTTRPGGHGGRVPVLGELPGVPAPDVDAVRAAWRRGHDPRVLVAPTGTDPAGRAVALDLVRDGPHVLVAGTTGAGKSELLTTLVLGLATLHPPRRLAVLLVDFKGGTGLGPLAGLPHVVDHVHDLDVAAARRTLVGLRAELRRRERVLAAAGRADLADLDPDDPATPARFLVVVDELRALVDDVPDAAATLARLAAQGRALGMHLLLATQRPAGAVPADLRANVGLRVALRVADEQDSRDVVDSVDAAHLDAGRPGAALVRVGRGPLTSVQVARARRRSPTPAVRLARTTGATDRWRAVRPPDDDVAAWVAACLRAARDLPGTGVPWLPELPARITAPDGGHPTGPDGLLVAVADRPDEQRRTSVTWTADDGPLLVLGGPRSGRTTTLLTVGAHALRAGTHVHAVGLPGSAVRSLRLVDRARLGTTAPLEDVHRVLLLLDRLSAGTTEPAVLLVDGLDTALDTLATHARGLGADLLTALLRHPSPGLRVAVAGAVVPAVTRHLGAFGLRLVLPSPDVALDAQAGVPSGFAGGRGVPGRAVACSPQGAVLCQVVLAAPGGGPTPSPRTRGPVRVGVLPDRSVAAADADAGRAGRIRLGVGGDAPGPVTLDPRRPLVVAGPPGAGRTTALVTLAQAWARSGRRVALLTSGAPADTLARWPTAERAAAVRPADAAAFLDELDGERPDGTRTRRTLVLVDDVDLLERTSAALADRVERLLEGTSPGARVVALATTSEHAATGLRGPVATALRGRHVLVLDPHGPAAADLLGPGSVLHADPRARPPGRGVLRVDRDLVRVQVDDASSHPSSAPGAA